MNGLPAEILRHIAAYLPLSSAAALTLSSRFILAKLGTVCFAGLTKDYLPLIQNKYRTHGAIPQPLPPQPEREIFLILLDRDLKETIYCYYCKIIHDPTETLKDLKKKGLQQRACARFESLRSRHWFHDDFYFSKLQFMMKRSERFGIDCSRELRRLSKTCTFYGKRFTHQLTSQVRIISSNIFVRMEHWLLVQGDNTLAPLHSPFRKDGYYRADICPHNNLIDFILPTFDANLARGPTEYDFSPKSVAYFTLYQCGACATEFQFDSAKCSEGLFALRVVAWMDFGTCQSPLDPKWATHRELYGSFDLRVSDTASGCIKTPFEDACSDEQALCIPKLPKGVRLKKVRKEYRTSCL